MKQVVRYAAPARLPVKIRNQVEMIRGSIDDAATSRFALECLEALNETNLRA